MNEVKSLTADEAVGNIHKVATQGDYFNSMDIDSHDFKRILARAEEDKEVEAEMEELELLEPGILDHMFPTEDHKGRKLPSKFEQCKALRASIANELGIFADNPFIGARRIEAMFTKSLQASLIGPPIDWVPDYQPLYPLLLMRSAPKDFKGARSGADPIQYETPISRGEAYNVDLNGNPQIIEVEGSNATIYPYFKETPAYTLEFYEWAKRLIKPMVIKKRQLIQELNYGWDADLISAFDAAVPDGTLYSAHPTHTTTVVNGAGIITQTTFRTAGRYLMHVDSTSGTVHQGIPGAAVCDPLAIFDIEAWGADVWTEVEVSEIAKNGFGVKYDGSVVTGKKVNGFNLLQMPVQHATTGRKVRFFARKQQVGYFVPVTVNGRNMHTRVMPSTSGGDPDWDKIRNSNEPPGFAFTIQAWQGGAIQIIGHFNTSIITH